jgi:hypothetical protein
MDEREGYRLQSDGRPVRWWNLVGDEGYMYICETLAEGKIKAKYSMMRGEKRKVDRE